MKPPITPIVILAALLPTLSAQDVRRGLVAYWPLDEVSPDGTTTPDKAWGSDLTLLNMSASNLVAGQRGNGMSFNGTNQLLYVDTGLGDKEGLPLNNITTKTICFWVRASGSAQQDRRIFSEASMDSTNPMWAFGTDSAASGRTGKVDFYIRNDDGGVPANHPKSVLEPLNNTWRHVAVTENNGALRVYVDGQLDSSTVSYTRGTMTLTTLALGGIQRLNGAVAFFNGTLDDVAVWRRVLSQTEIQDVMANGMATPIPPLVGVNRPGPYLEGDRVRLSVEMIGPEAASWQWRRNGANIAGATDSTYLTPGLAAETAGEYSVLVNGSLVSTTVNLTFAADPAPNLNANLISAWPFDELDESHSPATTPDLWGGNDLACDLIEGGNLVPGVFDNALSFDGFEEIAYRTTGFPYTASPEYSVSFWVKADTNVQSAADVRVFAEGSDTTNTPLFGMGTSNTVGSPTMRMYIRSDSNTAVVASESEMAIFNDVWHHVVWTDRNGQGRLYVDGVLDPAVFYYTRTGQVFTFNQTSVGAIKRAAVSHWLNGAVDDVGIWNRALTWSEVQALKTNGVPAPAAIVPPEVTVQPTPSTTVWQGRAVTLSIQATGSPPLAFQWLKDGAPVAGATEPTLVLDPATPAQTGSYTCRVTNSGGAATAATSAAAAVTVRAITGIDSGRLSTWPLDGGAVTTPDTRSGFALTLSGFTPASAYVEGKVGQGILFDGTDDYLSRTRTGTGGDSPTTTREEYTIAFWVQGTGTGQSDRRIFSEASTINNNPLFNIGTQIEGLDDLLYFYIRGDAGANPVNHIASFVPVLDGSWHHVIYTDFRGQGQLYVDGMADVALNYTKPAQTFNTVSVGSILRAAASHWFAGTVDEINTWERALTGEEAEAFYESAAVPPVNAAGFAITSISRPSAAQIQLTVATPLAGATYRVFASDSLANGAWTPVNDATISPVSGGTFTVSIPNPQGTVRFYRVTGTLP